MVGIGAMVEESPFVALGAAAGGGHIVDAVGRLAGHCRNCACTELAVGGVAVAAYGGLDAAWRVRQHVAWGVVGTWEIGG